ncbi:tissue factor pathway inhibitor 2-like [Anoplopoma fimbria]|uniref:tissue factor pathway inhibitor 2-like n=1 Tax=Anoplopoma fimbria TaxID=229290 RepID=UPI0023ED379D|nr:tissue factor pathway inhibitor 2-like [Anoplopoma fimbria]
MEFCILALFTLFSSFYNVLALSSKGACLLQVDQGPCRAGIKRYYYNTITQKCELFMYGGCQGNANNFKCYEECQKSCFRIPKVPQICRFPKKVGLCRALFRNYFFNMATMQCEPFHYGGCQGNSNRFQDLTACKEHCSPRKEVPQICRFPKKVGRCRALIRSYFFNMATMQCEPFHYGGCQGNSNRFQDLTACKEHCSP